MKPSFALLTLLSALPLLAADGAVTAGHVYDAGKGYFSTDPNVTDKADSEQCWAYSAANLIQLWQDYYLSASDDVSAVPNGVRATNYTLPVGTQYLEVAEVLHQNWKDEGAMQDTAFTWWMLGKDAVEEADRATMKADAMAAGYFSTLFKGEESCYGVLSLAENKEESETESDANMLMECIDEVCAVAGQGIGLAIYLNTGKENPPGHAITCWGYETDGEGQLSALYITDSDDSYYGATRINVVADEDGTLHLESNDSSMYEADKDYYIGFAEAIDTPDSIAAASPLASALSAMGGRLTENTRLTTEQTVSGGLTVAKEVILSGGSGSSLSISGSAGAGLAMEAGAMVSFNTMAALSFSGNAGAGLASESKTYVNEVASVTVSDNGDGGIQNNSYLEINDCGAVSLTGNRAASGSAISNQGQMLLAGNTEVTISGNVSDGGGAILNTGEMSILWNDSVTLKNNTVSGGGADAAINNSGTLTMAAEAGKHITLSGELYSTGTVCLSYDAEKNYGSGTVQMLEGGSVAAELNGRENAEGLAYLSSCVVSVSGIEGLNTENSATLSNINLVSHKDSDYILSSLNLFSDCSVTGKSLTLNAVTLVFDAQLGTEVLSYTADVSDIFHGTLSGDMVVKLSDSLYEALVAQHCLNVVVDFGEANTLSQGFTVAMENGALLSATGNTMTFLIPEPTTTALSLLALAGLCARRHRKQL